MTTPDEYVCPITMVLMEDPVMGSDGRTYERMAIETALHRDPRSPITREAMSASDLRPNYALKSLIERFRGTAVVHVQPPSSSKIYRHPFTTLPIRQVVVPSNQQPLLVVSSRPTNSQPSPKNMLGIVFAVISVGCIVALITTFAR